MARIGAHHTAFTGPEVPECTGRDDGARGAAISGRAQNLERVRDQRIVGSLEMLSRCAARGLVLMGFEVRVRHAASLVSSGLAGVSFAGRRRSPTSTLP